MSAALMAIEFEPGDSTTEQLNAAPATVAATPLQVAPMSPESVSVTVPEIVCEATVTIAPFTGAEMPIDGMVLSSFTVTDAVAVFAALSVTVPETAWLAVSVDTTTGAGHVSGGVPPAQVKATVTLDLFHPAALGGGVTEVVIVNPVGLKVTGMEVVAEFPAMSVARTAMVFGPATSVTVHDRLDWARVAGEPLQVTLEMPESESVTVPATGTGEAVMVAPDVGEAIVVVGGVLSILSVTESVAVWPALSVAVREMTWFAPSVVVTTGWGQVTGAVPPAQVKVTVTSELFHPAALGAGEGEAEIVNVVGEKVTPTFDVAVLPAISTACTAMVFGPATSDTLHDRADWVSVAGAPLQAALAMPESESVTVPVTATGEAVTVAPDVGEAIVVVGGVLSILSVTEAVALRPALSVAVREMTWFAPSVVVTTGWGQVTGAVPPAQVKVTVTSELFHPAALGAGEGEAEIVKVVGENVTLTVDVPVLPAISTACTAMVFGPATSDTLHDRAD